MKLHNPNNIKVHFAGLEKPNYAIVATEMGINYGLYTAFPFVASRIFKKRVWPIIPFKWMTDVDLEVPRFLNENLNHVIQDSGLFSLLYGKHQSLGTRDMVYKWFDELIAWTLEHGQDVTCVECDAQAIIGVEETWKLREKMASALPNNRIINVFHIQDGQYGLDRLIEYSDYIAIPSGIGDKVVYTYPLATYIKNKKPNIDIHLLGCTKEIILKKCANCVSSCDSITWLTQNRFGEFDKGQRIEYIDTEKVKSAFGENHYSEIRQYNGEKIANASIVSAKKCLNNYIKWCGNQN